MCIELWHSVKHYTSSTFMVTVCSAPTSGCWTDCHYPWHEVSCQGGRVLGSSSQGGTALGSCHMIITWHHSIIAQCVIHRAIIFVPCHYRRIFKCLKYKICNAKANFFFGDDHSKILLHCLQVVLIWFHLYLWNIAALVRPLPLQILKKLPAIRKCWQV